MNNPSKSTGFVYVMVNGRNNCKIGHSINPKKRLSQIKCGDGSIRLEFVSKEISNRVAVEKACHEKLSNKSLCGEWFDINPVDAIKTVNEVTSEIGVNCCNDNNWMFENKLLESKLLATGIRAKSSSESDRGKLIIFSYLELIASQDNSKYIDNFLSLCSAEQYLISCEYIAKAILKNKGE